MGCFKCRRLFLSWYSCYLFLHYWSTAVFCFHDLLFLNIRSYFFLFNFLFHNLDWAMRTILNFFAKRAFTLASTDTFHIKFLVVNFHFLFFCLALHDFVCYFIYFIIIFLLLNFCSIFRCS